MRLPADLVQRLRPSFQGVPVCVTGGAGFIGGHLVDALLSLGARIAVIDDLSNGVARHLSELIELEPDRVRFVYASILEPRALADALADARYVFHLAAIGSVPRSIEDPERSFLVNANGTLRVLRAASAVRSRRVVYSASSSAYGDTEALPKTETMPAIPTSPYGASKLAGEQLCAAWSRSYALSTACLRYFNVFGPRQPARSAYAAVIPAFVSAALAGEQPVIHGDGDQTRDFTPVASAVAANLLAAVCEAPLSGQPINVGSGSRISINELAKRIGAKLGRTDLAPVHAPARPGDVRDSLADVSRARELLGYQPDSDLDVHLDETIAWFETQSAAAGS